MTTVKTVLGAFRPFQNAHFKLVERADGTVLVEHGAGLPWVLSEIQGDIQIDTRSPHLLARILCGDAALRELISLAARET